MSPVLTIDLRGAWSSNIPFHERRDAVVRRISHARGYKGQIGRFLKDLSEAPDLLTYAVVWRDVLAEAELNNIKLIY